jgi:hypothetical protein
LESSGFWKGGVYTPWGIVLAAFVREEAGSSVDAKLKFASITLRRAAWQGSMWKLRVHYTVERQEFVTCSISLMSHPFPIPPMHIGLKLNCGGIVWPFSLIDREYVGHPWTLHDMVPIHGQRWLGSWFI